jgi:hypothetical protein
MREDLLQATEKLLTAIAGQVNAGRVSGAGKIGLRARRIANKHEVAKHLILDVGDHHLTWHRDQAAFLPRHRGDRRKRRSVGRESTRS